MNSITQYYIEASEEETKLTLPDRYQLISAVATFGGVTVFVLGDKQPFPPPVLLRPSAFRIFRSGEDISDEWAHFVSAAGSDLHVFRRRP
jgi:hypothetical protein